MKKKSMSLCLVVALAAVTVVGGSLAYFTAADKEQNDFTVGNVAIELQEPNWNAENATDMFPGQTMPKDPQVKNTGKNPAFIRVKITNPAGVDVTYNNMSDKWVAKGEYYYYNQAVAPGATTEAVFQSFTLSTATENATEENAAQNIKVEAEAVQSQGAPFDDDTFTADAAATWFATCGK